MDSLGRILAVSLVLLQPLLALQSQAQSVHGFNWGFSFTSSNIQECQNSTIQLKPLNSSTSFLGEPPYFMMALEVEGITTVTPIGDDPAHLSWQNTHRRNAALLLTVMDSAGNTGGFPVSFFNVIAASAGADTSCLIPAPTASTSRITPNVTTTIETCEPWGLTITGGIKPYSVTLAQIASGVITNVTMGPEDDVFTFIDRADPDRQLMAGVVDATGQWGISTIAVNTHGSTNTDCVGLISTSKTKAQIQAQASDAAVAKTAAAQRAHTTTVALGIIFGLVVPLLIGAGFLGWWWLRRRRLAAVHTVGAGGPRSAGSARDIFADPLYDPEHQHQDRPTLNIDMAQVGSVQRVSSQRHRTASWAVDGASSIAAPTPASAYPPPDSAGTQNRRTDSPTSIDMTSAELAQATPTPFLTPATVQYGPPPNSTSPAATLSPEARYRKALEAHAVAQAARARVAAARQSAVAGPSGEGAESPGPSAGAGAGGAWEKRRPVQRSQSLGMGVGVGGVVAAAALASASAGRMFPAQPLQRRGAGSASLRMPPLGEGESEAEEEERARPNIIIQHRDGGVVEELPPPYLDTFARSSAGTPRAPRRLGTA